MLIEYVCYFSMYVICICMLLAKYVCFGICMLFEYVCRMLFE